MNKLKVGIAIDSLLLPAWAAKVVEAMINAEHAELSLVAVYPAVSTPPVPFLYSLYKKRDDKKRPSAPDAFEQKDISGLIEHVPLFKKEGPSPEQVDVLLNFCQGIPADILTLSRHGVWQYFFSECRECRVPGVWEVLERRPVTISGLEVISQNGERRTIYRSYALTDPASVKASRNRYYWKSVSFVGRMLRTLYDDPGHFSMINVPDETTVKSGSKYLEAPSNLSFISILLRNTAKRIVNKLKRLSVKRDWILMYGINSSEGEKIAVADLKKLVAPDGYFWADPVVVQEKGKHYVFLEEYVYADGRGRISVIEIDEQGHHSEAMPVLERPYHLSYPFVFEKDGTYYMIPESSANRTIELYECISFPHKWQFRKNLMEGVAAVDSTVLYHNDKWWLFVNVEENKGAASMDELFLFYTDDIINSKLIAHPQNPVVSDVRSARPAGRLFFKDRELFRPSQICAPHYGWGVSVNKVNKLSERDYEETPSYIIAPDEGLGIAGIHTLSYSGKLCVIDALMDMKK